jgi:AAA domain
MALSLGDLKRVRATDPPRVLIYGPPGMGKTTLASEWPDPVFLQVEDGTPGDVELVTFGKIENYNEVLDAIEALYGVHDRKTLVIDSLDRLEPMVWDMVRAEGNWPSIESPGYGKGYVLADKYWRDLIAAANGLRRDRGMHIVYVAHSAINQVDDPMTTSYSRFDIKLHKRAIGIFQDEVDAILFLNQDITIKHDDKTGKTAPRNRADGGGNRWLYAAPRPAFVAKNRYGLPDKMLCDRGKGFAAIGPYFPVATAMAAQAAAPQAANETAPQAAPQTADDQPNQPAPAPAPEPAPAPASEPAPAPTPTPAPAPAKTSTRNRKA